VLQAVIENDFQQAKTQKDAGVSLAGGSWPN